MIQPNEIRAGNILNHITAEGDVIETTIDGDSIKWCEEDPKGFNSCHFPIPLTEEVLLRCGFEVRTIMDYERGYTYMYHHPKIGLVSSDFVYCINDTNEYAEYDYIVDLGEPMTALHQLQNLFFALTGKELEYRVDK